MHDPVVIASVHAGRAVPYTRPGSVSAIHKTPLHGMVHVGSLGIVGDEQGDPRVHGGVDKAVHHYPFDHYAHWRDELGELPRLQAAGAFGENLSSHGLREDTVCLGDRYRIGSVVLEVSQGRQPCWKLNDRFDVPDMARRVQDTGRTGWYYRVIAPGTLTAGDALQLEARPHPLWSLRRLGTLLFQRRLDPDDLRPALELPLVPSWRKLLESRLQRGAVEDWSKRIDGPPSQAGE